MRRASVRTSTALVAVGLLATAGRVYPQDASEAATVDVRRGPFSVVLDANGILDAPEALEVAYRPRVYSGELTVVEATPPGRVQKGQVLVRLRSDGIDEHIRQAEIELELARTALRLAEADNARKEESVAITLQRAEIDYRTAEKTYTTYVEVERPLKIQQAELMIQMREDFVQEQRDDYDQFNKMQSAGDLPEVTRNLDTRQQKRFLDLSEVSLAEEKRRHEVFLDVTMPRELSEQELALRKARSEWKRAQTAPKLQIAQSCNDVAKARDAVLRQEKSLEALRNDREDMKLLAPQDGQAVAGRLARGKWSGLDETARALRPGARVSTNQVVFTVVRSDVRSVRATVPEAAVISVREGQSAEVSPLALPGVRLAGRVSRVSPIGVDGRFDVWVDLTPGDPRLLPGNSCKVKLRTGEKPDAITVPVSAVGRDGARRVVHVWQGGAASPREVQVGRTSEGRVEILSGVEPGERVLEKAPRNGPR